MSTPPEPPGGEWREDPRGRHELRYWDGARWTDHVADAGVQAQDAYYEKLPPTPSHRTPVWKQLKWAIPGIIVLLLIGAAAGGGGDKDDDEPAVAESKAEPRYEIAGDETRGLTRSITVRVQTSTGLRDVFDAVRARFDEDDGGYFISIDCTTGGTAGAANRLANGRYAVGAKGAAATGLDEGAVEYEPNQGRSCPAP